MKPNWFCLTTAAPTRCRASPRCRPRANWCRQLQRGCQHRPPSRQTLPHINPSSSLKKIALKVLDPRMADCLPSYATNGSAGLDFGACIASPLVLAPGSTEQVPTGLSLHLAHTGYAAHILTPPGPGHQPSTALGNLNSGEPRVGKQSSPTCRNPRA